MATSIRVSFAPRRTQRANRWPNIAPSSRGATSRPIDMPVPTMKICSSTCTMVCHTGINAPPTAFLTDGTVVVRVRSSHQITAAMEAPTVTEMRRRRAGTLKGPDSCAFSMYPSAKRSTWYSMSVSKPAAAPMGDADDGHRRDQRREYGRCSAAIPSLPAIASTPLPLPRCMHLVFSPSRHSCCRITIVPSTADLCADILQHESQYRSHRLRLHSERPIRLVVLGNEDGHSRQVP